MYIVFQIRLFYSPSRQLIMVILKVKNFI